MAEFQPAGQQPVLFMSDASLYEHGKAIRGGVPICFPWFGSNPAQPSAPAHGLARTSLWEVTQSSLQDGTVCVVLNQHINDFELNYEVLFGKSLQLSMRVHNTSNRPQSFELALHSYFHVQDSSQVAIRGLENLEFIDQLSGETQPAEQQEIGFTAETDRIYHWPDGQEAAEIEIYDPGLGRTLHLRSLGSRSTVVWNPWIAKSRRMPDFGDAEYQVMCCVETANIGSQAIRLDAQQNATTSVCISVK